MCATRGTSEKAIFEWGFSGEISSNFKNIKILKFMKKNSDFFAELKWPGFSKARSWFSEFLGNFSEITENFR